MGDAESLPSAHIKRIVKAKLAELTAGEGEQKREVSVQKEALKAFAESATVFIHYLTATANEICHESKRLTINAEDVMKAIDEVEFHEFAEPLREALAGASRADKRVWAHLWREASRGVPGADARVPRVAQRSRRLPQRSRRRPPPRRARRSARRTTRRARGTRGTRARRAAPTQTQRTPTRTTTTTLRRLKTRRRTRVTSDCSCVQCHMRGVHACSAAA